MYICRTACEERLSPTFANLRNYWKMYKAINCFSRPRGRSLLHSLARRLALAALSYLAYTCSFFVRDRAFAANFAIASARRFLNRFRNASLRIPLSCAVSCFNFPTSASTKAKQRNYALHLGSQSKRRHEPPRRRAPLEYYPKWWPSKVGI